jgi:hypothetical protein
VPRGVVPAVAPRKRVDPIVWRVAATLLVVAGGTLIVARNNGGDKQPSVTNAESVEFAQVQRGGPVMDTSPSVASQTAPATAPAIMNSRKTPAAIPTPKNPATRSSAEARRKSQPDASATENRLAQTTTGEARASVRHDQAAPALGRSADANRGAGAAAPSAPRPTPYFAPMRGAVSGVTDAVAEPTPLRIVGTPHVIGEKHTLYELAPGDTVLLAEAQSVRLEGVTVSAATEARARTEKTTTMSVPASAPTTAAPPPPPADNRRAAAASSNLAASATESVATDHAANGVTTIRWIDPTTGNAMRLSGRHSREELLEIKRRIEQARAAEAIKK